MRNIREKELEWIMSSYHWSMNQKEDKKEVIYERHEESCKGKHKIRRKER